MAERPPVLPVDLGLVVLGIMDCAYISKSNRAGDYRLTSDAD